MGRKLFPLVFLAPRARIDILLHMVTWLLSWRRNKTYFVQIGNRHLTCWVRLQQVMLCYVMWHALKWPEAMSFCVTVVELCCSLLNNHGKAYPHWSQIIGMPPLQSREIALPWIFPPESFKETREHMKPHKFLVFSKVELKHSGTQERHVFMWQGSNMVREQPVLGI